MVDTGQTENEVSAAYCTLAATMLQEGKHRDVLTVARYVLARVSDDIPALFFASKAEQAAGDIGKAVACMARLVETGRVPTGFPYNLPEEARSLLVEAIGEHGRHIGAGRFQEALLLTEDMIRIAPQTKQFIESALSLCRALGNREKEADYRLQLHKLNKAEHEQLQELATKSHEAGRYEEELASRLAMFEHPYDLEIHSAWRLQNIHHALGCLFIEPLDAERQQLAKRLIAAVPSPDDLPDPEKGDMLGRFDKFYRLSIRAIDIDAIYGPPVQSAETPRMRFADSAGHSLTIDDLRQKVVEQNVQVGFFAAGTRPYFERCAKYYIESILKHCDASCLVFVCATCGWDTAENVARSLGIDDQRLIVCTDAFDYQADDYLVYTTNDIKPDDDCPHRGTHYYACVGLLHLAMFIEDIGIPVFLSGMDTVLQRGVGDLLERFRNADIVVNRSPLGKHMSSTLVNSLQLIYPTANAMIFASFLKDRLGNAVKQVHQHFAMDQLFLFMAMHHLLANGSNPQVAFFDEFDINNCMFNTDNVELYRTHLEKFRFVNIFHGGQADKALSGEQVLN